MLVLRNIGHSRVSPDQRRFWGICGSLEGDGSCFTCSEPAPASAGTSEALPMWIQMARLSQLALRLTLDCKSSPRRCPLLSQVTFNLVRIHAWSWDLSPEPSVGKRTAAGSGLRQPQTPPPGVRALRTSLPGVCAETIDIVARHSHDEAVSRIKNEII